MKHRQLGVSLMGLIMALFVVVIVGIFSLKLIPPFIEYGKAKTAIVAIASDKASSGTVAEVRKAFDARANIDDITAIKPSDLEITKEGGDVVIGFAYRKEIPLAGNVGLYIDFVGRSNQ